MRTEVHIGKLIENTLREDGRSVSWLAKKINYKRDNVYNIFERESINTALLQEIGFALKKDFFTYYSEVHKRKMDEERHL